MTPNEAIGYAKEQDAKIVDLKFMDFVGMWQHFSVPIDEIEERTFEEGFGFVAMGRALIADPDLVRRMQAGEVTRSRCTACNLCVVEMDRGGTRCVLPRASGE